jgi:non-specific serine/threonine protein kinase
MAMFEDDHERAVALLEEARRTGGEYANMISLENLAEVALAQGDFDRALTLAEEAFGLARRSGSPRMVANMGLAVGRIRLGREEVEESGAALHESLVLWREVDDPRGTADCVEALGELAAACGDGERAATMFGAASSLRRSVGAVQSPERRAQYSHYIELAREAVGTAAFDHAFALAAQTPLEEVIGSDETAQSPVGLARTLRKAAK